MSSSEFAKQCLKAHNSKRKNHSAPELKLNDALCKLAQSWADQLVSRNELKHSDNKLKGEQLGENVACKTSTGAVATYTGEEVTEQWYSEVKAYDYAAGDPNLKAGHFSQVVWKNSRELGVGIASKNGRCVVVANYYPAGNYIGQYKENVLPPTLTSKVKALVTGKSKKAAGESDSSSDSSDDESRKGKKDKPSSAKGANFNGGASAEPVVSSKGTYTRKITTTRTIKKADGSVETVTEERIEEGPSVDEALASKLTIGDRSQTEKKATSSPKAQDYGDFCDDALKTHNAYRVKHSAPPLKLSKELCKMAQTWADNLAKISTLQHSNSKLGGEPLGENCASKWGSNGADYTGKEVTDQWYSEESAYDYSGKSNAGNSGHFTQVVWKGSSELGIGKAKDAKGRVYVVANYKPAGNYIGKFAESVSRPK